MLVGQEMGGLFTDPMLVSPIISDKKDEKRRYQTPQTLFPLVQPPFNKRGEGGSVQLQRAKVECREIQG